MKGLGNASRETGHRRVPEPPDRMTGINMGEGLIGANRVPRRKSLENDAYCRCVDLP
jgi:hypothetical protein